MERVVVLIGVSRTGGFPTLPAVGTAIKRMERWALLQEIPKDRIFKLSDEKSGDEVRPHHVSDVITALAKRGSVEQLIVYFCGHGIVFNLAEIWLLSRPGEAIDLGRSEILARRSPFEHVVFISDACRTAASATIQAQSLHATPVFPSTFASRKSREVDVFYGSLLGDPAYQVQQDADQWQPVYTNALADCLDGDPEHLVHDEATAPFRRLVRPRPLKEYLDGLTLQNGQTPDAQVSSGPQAWISLLGTVTAKPVADAGTDAVTLGSMPGMPARARGIKTLALPDGIDRRTVAVRKQADPLDAPAATGIAGASPVTARAVFNRSWNAQIKRPHAPIQDPRSVLDRFVHRFKLDATVSATLFEEETHRRYRDSVPPDDMVSGLSFPAQLPAEVSSSGGSIELEHAGANIQVEPQQPEEALVVFQDGRGVLVPVIHGYVGVVVYRDGRIDHVAYERSRYSEGWNAGRANQLRMLRAIASTASSLGVLRLDQSQAADVVDFLQGIPFYDPALMLYAAYAFHDAGREDLIERLHQILVTGLGLDMFDLALLAENFSTSERETASLATALPLLGRGWRMTDVLGGEVPRAAESLPAHVCNSLWTLYEPPAINVLRDLVHARHAPAFATTY